MGNAKTGTDGNLRIHQRLLQSTTTPLSTGLEKLRRLRTESGLNEHRGAALKCDRSTVGAVASWHWASFLESPRPVNSAFQICPSRGAHSNSQPILLRDRHRSRDRAHPGHTHQPSGIGVQPCMLFDQFGQAINPGVQSVQLVAHDPQNAVCNLRDLQALFGCRAHGQSSTWKTFPSHFTHPRHKYFRAKTSLTMTFGRSNSNSYKQNPTCT